MINHLTGGSPPRYPPRARCTAVPVDSAFPRLRCRRLSWLYVHTSLTRYSAAQQRPGRSRCQVESGTSDVRTSDESTRLETTQKVLSCERAARSISVRARDSSTSTRDQRCSASARRACRRHALSHTGERDAALSGSLARWRVEWVREMSASGHAQTAMWWWRRTRRRKETEREAEEWR